MPYRSYFSKKIQNCTKILKKIAQNFEIWKFKISPNIQFSTFLQFSFCTILVIQYSFITKTLHPKILISSRRKRKNRRKRPIRGKTANISKTAREKSILTSNSDSARRNDLESIYGVPGRNLTLGFVAQCYGHSTECPYITENRIWSSES